MGERVFMAQCQQCHPGGAAGLGPAINNKPLPAFLIRYQVRRGLGAMPEFDEAVISDADLDALVAYLQELRRQRAS
jgi:mono/diheme cytochrome c family protein